MVRLPRIVTATAAGTLLALGLGGGVARSAEPPTHAAITIVSDADFVTCACVTSGSGTAADPYVIGPWTISAESSGGWALKVDNSSGASEESGRAYAGAPRPFRRRLQCGKSLLKKTEARITHCWSPCRPTSFGTGTDQGQSGSDAATDAVPCLLRSRTFEVQAPTDALADFTWST